MAAASDGAAMPPMIEPSTASTRLIGGATTRSDLARELQARHRLAFVQAPPAPFAA